MSVFNNIASLTLVENNNDIYRRKLASTLPPCVPYLGIYLGDLTYLNECMKKDRGDSSRAQQYNDRLTQVFLLQLVLIVVHVLKQQ